MDVNPPFTDQEKRFVLAEAIKTSTVPVDKILPIFVDGTIQPDWPQMLLPHGRNLQSCINAFDAIRPSQPLPPPPSFQPQSYQIPLPAAPKPTKRKPPPESLETGSSANPPKRRISDIPQQHTSILPKPSVGSPGQGSPSTAPGKKRGRPSKAAVALRDAEAIARGEVIAPPPRTSSLRPDTPGRERVSTPMYANIAPMLSPRPVPSPITPAAYDPPSFTSAKSEAASPGKKKRTPQKKAPKQGEPSFPVMYPEPSSSRSERTTYPSIVSSLTDTIPTTYSGQTSVPPMSQPIQILHPPVSTYGPPPPPPPPARTESQ